MALVDYFRSMYEDDTGVLRRIHSPTLPEAPNPKP